MKKNLIVLLAIFSVTLGNAQSLMFRDPNNGNTNLNNQHLYFYLPPTDIITGFPTIHAYFVNVFNQSADSLHYKIKTETIQLVQGSAIQFCQNCGGGQCYIGNLSGTFTLFAAADCEWDWQFKVGTGTIFGTSVVRYTAYDIANTNDSATMYMHYIVTPAGIDAINTTPAFLSEPVPNPATTTVRFQFETNQAQAKVFEVYNLLGEKVAVQNVNATSGTIELSVADLPAGIYNCVLSAATSAPVMRKLVVTR